MGTDCDGDPATVLTRDEMLDNIMLYWLPGTGVSAARLYWESFRKPLPGPVNRAGRLLVWGGHFAAFEQPGTFVTEVCAAFRPLRQD